MTELYVFEQRAIQLRKLYDPLDDALRPLGFPKNVLPNMNENWFAKMKRDVKNLLSEIAEVDTNVDLIEKTILISQLNELNHKLEMKPFIIFACGYDYSPLGRVVSGISSLDVVNEDHEALFEKLILSIGPYIKSCALLVQESAGKRIPLASNIEKAISQWKKIIESNGKLLFPKNLSLSLQNDSMTIFNQFVKSSIEIYIAELEKTLLLARTDINPGLCGIEGGREDYQTLVDSNTGCFGSISMIHDFGKSEVFRLQNVLRKVSGLNCDSSIALLLEATIDDVVYNSGEEFMEEFYETLSTVKNDFLEVIDLAGISKLGVEVIPKQISQTSSGYAANAPA